MSEAVRLNEIKLIKGLFIVPCSNRYSESGLSFLESNVAYGSIELWIGESLESERTA